MLTPISGATAAMLAVPHCGIVPATEIPALAAVLERRAEQPEQQDQGP